MRPHWMVREDFLKFMFKLKKQLLSGLSDHSTHLIFLSIEYI